MFEMSAHYANTGTETLSPFVDSSVDNVLLQTQAYFNQFLLEFTNIPKRHLVDSLLHDSQTL